MFWVKYGGLAVSAERGVAIAHRTPLDRPCPPPRQCPWNSIIWIRSQLESPPLGDVNPRFALTSQSTLPISYQLGNVLIWTRICLNLADLLKWNRFTQWWHHCLHWRSRWSRVRNVIWVLIRAMELRREYFFYLHTRFRNRSLSLTGGAIGWTSITHSFWSSNRNK